MHYLHYIVVENGVCFAHFISRQMNYKSVKKRLDNLFFFKTSWFPNKGSSRVFENWDAPKMGGRSGLYKMGDSAYSLIWLAKAGWQGWNDKARLAR